MAQSMSDHELVQTLKALKIAGTSAGAAKALGITPTAVRSRTMEAKSRGLLADSAVATEADRLRLDNDRLRAEIANTRRENLDAEEIRRTIYGLAEFDPEPPEWTIRDKGPMGHRGVPITLWSDWHHGERINKDEVGGLNEFTPAIFDRRVKKLVNTVVDLTMNHMGNSRRKYPGMIVCLGGDMMTGDIHDDLRETNWATPQQSIEQLTEALASGLDALAGRFGRLFIPAVVGNHGRGTLRPRAKNRVFTSHEWNIYSNLARHFRKSKHVQFLIPNNTDAYFRAFGHRYLLTHGDALGVKGGDGIIGALGPIMRGALKVGRSEAQIGRDFDTLVIGHWHQYMNPPGVIGNGALCGYNEYARVQLRARYERPTQALWFSHPEHGITASWPMYLEPKAGEVNNKWVEWQQ